jgi:sulfur transfer complex TusBCD TusB component (DsrH family)
MVWLGEDVVNLRLTAPQRAAAQYVLEFLQGLPIVDLGFEVLVGAPRGEVAQLEERLRTAVLDDGVVFSLAELHVLHSALVSAVNQYLSEEDFYTRLGFFRENIAAFARELVRALTRTDTPHQAPAASQDGE